MFPTTHVTLSPRWVSLKRERERNHRGDRRMWEGKTLISLAAVHIHSDGRPFTAASQLAGVPKPYFLGHLADYGVNTFDLSEEELSHDLKSA
jgi:hypothetical protein